MRNSRCPGRRCWYRRRAGATEDGTSDALGGGQEGSTHGQGTQVDLLYPNAHIPKLYELSGRSPSDTPSYGGFDHSTHHDSKVS